MGVPFTNYSFAYTEHNSRFDKMQLHLLITFLNHSYEWIVTVSTLNDKNKILNDNYISHGNPFGTEDGIFWGELFDTILVLPWLLPSQGPQQTQHI